MRAVVQRVIEAKVEVKGVIVGEIGRGVLVFVGVGEGDCEKDSEFLAGKVAHLRIFPDENDLLNRSLIQIEGAALVVSQFTLWGDCRKGRRPSFVRAAHPEKAKKLYEHFVTTLRGRGLSVATGKFQEMMEVHLVNDGPVTLLMDSTKTF